MGSIWCLALGMSETQTVQARPGVQHSLPGAAWMRHLQLGSDKSCLVQAAGIRQGAGGFWDEFSLDTLVEAGLPEHLEQVHLAICTHTQPQRCNSLACCGPQ